MTESHVVLFAAPIPVGHRVELRWYPRITTRLFGGESREERPHEPLVVDLDTGVEYLTDFWLPHDAIKRSGEPLGIALDDLDRSAPDTVVRGVVRSCRVVTVRGFGGDIDLQTHLAIERQG